MSCPGRRGGQRVSLIRHYPAGPTVGDSSAHPLSLVVPGSRAEPRIPGDGVLAGGQGPCGPGRLVPAPGCGWAPARLDGSRGFGRVPGRLWVTRVRWGPPPLGHGARGAWGATGTRPWPPLPTDRSGAGERRPSAILPPHGPDGRSRRPSWRRWRLTSRSGRVSWMAWCIFMLSHAGKGFPRPGTQPIRAWLLPSLGGQPRAEWARDHAALGSHESQAHPGTGRPQHRARSAGDHPPAGARSAGDHPPAPGPPAAPGDP